MDEWDADVGDITDAPALWRLLVRITAAPELAPSVAVEAFRRHHSGGEEGAYDSALLLCTDWRWRRTSAKVLAGIVDSQILDITDQDRLADALLWRDKVPYTHPTGWFGTTFIEIDLDRPGSRKVSVDPRTPMIAERHVWPPLRSWAATRVLARQRSTPARVLKRARSLPPHDGAAVVVGAVRAADELDDAQERAIIDAALQWRHKAPRKAALELLLTRGAADRSLAIAAADRDASIRAWARKHLADREIQGRLFD